MRIIAGSRKKMQLETVAGLGTRPTTDRIKETLFNILAEDVYDSRFLDLFAGSGQIGLEALSRGASHACFVEKDPAALSCLKRNITKTRFEEETTVLTGDVLRVLPAMVQTEPFHIIFMDPPYQAHIEPQVLEQITRSQLLADDGYVVIEADLSRDFSFATTLGYRCFREKKYKTNQHVFLTKDD